MKIEKYAKDILNLVTECLNEMIINDDLSSIMHFILTRLIKITDKSLAGSN